MKSQLVYHSHVIDFLMDDFDYDRIDPPLQNLVNSYLKNYNIPELEEWTLQFTGLLGGLDKIYVCLKGKSDARMKCKEITIHIPIPSKSKVSWGVLQEQVPITRGPKSGYCEEIQPEAKSFDNKYDFIVDCMSKGIELAFRKGFAVNKIKVRTD
ncbi:MAG: Imm9 family immunity protein [Bacteroidota bacterium]